MDNVFLCSPQGVKLNPKTNAHFFQITRPISLIDRRFAFSGQAILSVHLHGVEWKIGGLQMVCSPNQSTFWIHFILWTCLPLGEQIQIDRLNAIKNCVAIISVDRLFFRFVVGEFREFGGRCREFSLLPSNEHQLHQYEPFLWKN